LGQIVPPSTAIIIYALLVEESIGRLFIATIGAAVLATILYMITVTLYVRLFPSSAPPSQTRPTLKGIAKLFGQSWGVLLLFILVMGGIYSGFFTETEAAAVGALGTFLFALFRGKINRQSLWSTTVETTATIAMIYALMIGATEFSFFIGVTQLPDLFVALFQTVQFSPLTIIMILVIVYLILGMVMDSFANMFITVPIFVPLVMDLGYDPIWWGIITVILVETGMISPPFGLNLFILKSVDKDLELGTIYRGVVPFFITDLVRVAILIAVPSIILWLPSTIM